MITKDEAIKKVQGLVKRFDDQKEFYKNSEYKELSAREDFINPFFKYLGWDVDNQDGYAETYREVILEERIEDRTNASKTKKAPDYSFRLSGGKRLFFVEAKKPSIEIKNDADPAYQVRRYGWSAKLPVSILTDFEEFSVYDCAIKPKPTDKASAARIKYLRYSDYLSQFDFLWDTFSKEKVLKGSFDKFVQGSKQKRGTTTVDYDFLNSLDRWRTQLANNIALRNEIEEDKLNFVVQAIIDRLIFLRIAEDRHIEPYEQLKGIIKNKNNYNALLQDFHIADQKYNSGLFDFKKDKISGEINIDNKVIESIIKELYYPVCPYEFSVFPVEVLGNAYEQFLGKRITLSKGGRAVIEEKPEVRKAGGVYYTPQYIVDYIVKNTVGKLIENKIPKKIAGIKIVDPACGSGSFLVGAYQYLLDYHKAYYLKNPQSNKNSKQNPLTPTGELTTAEKKKILLNNIYGVDLDENAVEVTKLSLLLKCMEGETEASVNTESKIFHDRILPTLDNNIKSGNSLIDLDFYDNELDFGEEKRVKPFSWQKAFPEVFKQDGFDCVIGNPPWVDLKGHPAELVRYYFDVFSTTENRINLYSIFIEKSLKILSIGGIFGFIIPNSLLYQSSFEKVRKLILKDWNIDSIVRLPDNVFNGVKAETIIITINKTAKEAHCLLYDRHDIINSIGEDNASRMNDLNPKDWIKNEFTAFDIFSNDKEKKLLKKIETNKTGLEKLCDFTLGITPYDKYKGHTTSQIKNRVFHSSTKKDKTFKPLLEGSDVKRYLVEWGHKEYISYGDWLGAPRKSKFFTTPRILVRQIVSGDPLRIYAGYTEEELFNVQSIFNIIVKGKTKIDLKYLLAIINSNMMNFYHSHKYLDISKNLFQKILIQNCKKFPIKIIDIKNKIEVQQQGEIIKLVDQLLMQYANLKGQTLQYKIDQLQSRIDYCEDRINELVYQLYGLTKEEIKIIEQGE